MSITDSANIFEQSANKVLADILDGGRSGESGRGSWRRKDCIFKSYQNRARPLNLHRALFSLSLFAPARISLDVSEQWSFNGAISVK
jgi:hypothetical protein